MEQMSTELRQLSTESDLAVPALTYTIDVTPASFIAEYAIDGDDIVYHFYPPRGGMVTTYWKSLFPNSLERVAMQQFDAGPPRLKAAYTEEMSSWWLRAYGFAIVGDPDLRSQALFKKLDEDFSSEITKARGDAR